MTSSSQESQNLGNQFAASRIAKSRRRRLRAALWTGLCLPLAISALASARYGELPSHIPEPPPYVTRETEAFPPPYDHYFAQEGGPQVCARCHKRIVDEWNGSMMANAWRDPAWRAAFFLIARLTATDGNCDIPAPPDGTPKAKINPFANADCTSTFDIGTEKYTTNGSGGLVDSFCSRCHMPANYIDAFQPKNVKVEESGVEHALADPDFDPTSARDTEFAFATIGTHNSDAGKMGITCSFCHTMAETRLTPYHNYPQAESNYVSPPGRGSRLLLPSATSEMPDVPSSSSQTLGYAVGAGAYRISPEALLQPERFGPLSHRDHTGERDPYLSSAFARDINRQTANLAGSIHKGNYNVMFERAEMCATCHDVTNPISIKNPLGHWVGGFPIERTYSEWSLSRYADRPGNKNFNPAFKRDCQTCHMQQHFGAPGTAQTLFGPEGPIAPLSGKPALTSPERTPYFSHHFVGGNAFTTRLVGANVDANGKPYPYPEVSKYSFSSEDPSSPYHNAYFENTGDKGPPTYQARMAWDRLRNALEIDLKAPPHVAAGSTAKLHVAVTNSGTGHNFPTGFPEGRNAWVAVRAFDLATGREMQISDSFWKRSSLGIGYLTDHDMIDPNFPGCNWEVPAGGPDPYAWQFRAVASLGDGCPTLALPYATALNLVVNADGVPIDKEGHAINRLNPRGIPQFKDLDKDGDVFDDAFLIDNRLRPLPNAGAHLNLDRYSIAIPEGTVGPVSVVTAVYYQSFEAAVAKKLLGNLADTDGDHVLEPCVLRGPCDGRVPQVEPAVVEGAPPIPIRVESTVINVDGQRDATPPELTVYPNQHELKAMPDVVAKVTASEPVTGIDATTFMLEDARGASVPAHVAQISDYTYALFPDQVFLDPGQTYRARVYGRICDLNANCVNSDLSWTFSVSSGPKEGGADTRPPTAPHVSAPEKAPVASASSATSASLVGNAPAGFVGLSALAAFGLAFASWRKNGNGNGKSSSRRPLP